MGFIVFGIVIEIILVIVFARLAGKGYELYNLIAAVFAFFVGIAAAVTIICFCVLGWKWKASEYKAEIINREYRTSYTREEIFYGADVIDIIKQLDRKRYEINGNVMQSKE